MQLTREWMEGCVNCLLGHLLDRLLYRLHDCIGFYNCLLDHLLDCLAGIYLYHRLLDRHLD